MQGILPPVDTVRLVEKIDDFARIRHVHSAAFTREQILKRSNRLAYCSTRELTNVTAHGDPPGLWFVGHGPAKKARSSAPWLTYPFTFSPPQFPIFPTPSFGAAS